MVFEPDWVSLNKRTAQLTVRTLECGEFTTAAALRQLVKKIIWVGGESETTQWMASAVATS